MTTYTWKIEAVDAASGTMLVEFTNDGVSQMLNLQVPPDGTALADWVDGFAPRAQWQQTRTSTITVGTTGEAPIVKEVPPEEPTETAQVSGSFNEEYLRALIYQVLEDIQASTVPAPAPEPAPAPAP